MSITKTSFGVIVGIAVAALIFPANLNASREPVEAEVVGDFIPVTLDFNKVIADFNINNGNPPNNLGGSFGEIPVNSPCEFVADAPDALGNPTGHSMRLTHPPQYNSCFFFSNLGPDPVVNHPLDASSYKSVNFYMKSNFTNGPLSFGIHLQDTAASSPRKIFIGNIPTNTWKKVSIPFQQFQRAIYNGGPILDFSRLASFYVSFESVEGGDTAFIDQIALSKQVADLTISDFEYGNYNNLGGFIQTWSNEFDGCGLGFTQGYVHVPFNLTHIAGGCALYMRLGREPVRDIPLDTSDYKTISFDVKGNMNSDAPLILKVELDDADYFKSFNYTSGITSDWKTYSIPLAAFGRQIDKTRLTQFTITADTYLTGIPSSGQFYVDNVILKPQVSDLLLADFNAVNAPNNLYAQYGEFTGGGQCMTSRVADASGDPQGRALRIDYGNMAAVDPYCGIWLETGPQSVDLRDYRFLKMKVKGDSGLGFPQDIRIDLRTEEDELTHDHYAHVPVTSDWNEVVVPLNEFYPINQLGRVEQLAITIDSNEPAQGAVYIDDIRFTRRRADLVSEAIAAEAIVD